MFFELIQVALGVRERLSRNPSDEEWGRVFQMAKEQAVAAFVFPALEQLSKLGQKPPTAVLLEWFGLAEQVKAQNGLMNQEAARLTTLFENEGHQTAILKGQANARLYNCHTDCTDKGNDLSLLRQPGDIDVWVSGGKERVVQTLRKLHLVEGELKRFHSDKAQESYHHIHLPRNEQGVDVEVHFRPSSGNYDPFTNRRLQAFLSREIAQENELVSEGFRVPSTRFALVMQLAHIQRHFIDEGVGMRQIIDYYYLLRKWRMENEELGVDWKSLGLHHIAGAMMWLMKEVLLMDEGWMIASPDEKRGRMLLEVVMAGGNFGKYTPYGQMGSHNFSPVRAVANQFEKYKMLRFDVRETIWGEIDYIRRFIPSIPERIRRRSWTLR